MKKMTIFNIRPCSSSFRSSLDSPCRPGCSRGGGAWSAMGSMPRSRIIFSFLALTRLAWMSAPAPRSLVLGGRIGFLMQGAYV